ncbi:hypothetical protein [Pandoraea sputorum]|uniref:hypothetical protein n=1 Tax=Pandoraea sputorum TaxID=93222 RepID=UPI002AF6C0B3|nr:hypothetical protein [Pandoraea sputorum]
MHDPKTVTFDAIRAAGGIVHSDGNIFFTNAEQFHAAADSIRTPAAQGAVREELVRNIKDAIRELSGGFVYPDLIIAVDQLAALSADVGETATLEGVRDKLFDGRPVTRDAEGWYRHPAIPLADEDVNYEKLLTALRVETVFVSMENDNPEAAERYGEAGEGDCHYWTPTPPEGDDWCLLSVYDTEDGPYALFGRDAYIAEQKRKRENTRRMADAIADNTAKAEVMPKWL